MCFSLNKKCPILSRERIQTLLSEEYTITQKQIKVILKREYFSITTDGCTSFANVGYATCTAHFINQETWTLHSIVMFLFEKMGGSIADYVVDYCEYQLFFLPFLTVKLFF